MRPIKKIYNNNIVTALDRDGEEVILVGAGVGYLRSRGQSVDESRVEREFRLTGLLGNGAFRVLLEIPHPVLRAVSKVTEFLRQTHGVALTSAAEVALADHVDQALVRMSDGASIYNSMLWETKMTYPAEFAIALEVMQILHEELGQKLPLDEAGFITLHLINAGVVGDQRQAATLSSVLNAVIEIIDRELGIVLDDTTTAGTRLLTHLKFVVQRITKHQVFGDASDDFLSNLKHSHPAAHECAREIGHFLDTTYGAQISEEERMYLMVHLIRLEDETRRQQTARRDTANGDEQETVH